MRPCRNIDQNAHLHLQHSFWTTTIPRMQKTHAYHRRSKFEIFFEYLCSLPIQGIPCDFSTWYCFCLGAQPHQHHNSCINVPIKVLFFHHVILSPKLVAILGNCKPLYALRILSYRWAFGTCSNYTYVIFCCVCASEIAYDTK